MNSIAIKAEGLGKKYLIGHQSQASLDLTLRDEMTQAVRNLWSRSRAMVRGDQIVMGDELEEFWALTDVGFEIRQGDALGIIGRNGAGKSTLLKVLSRITEPTTGRVEIHGRVASLLEVGTGFHPELSGRENIYLNGGILGMTKSEIRKRFDSIVEFAGVERYIDTPVKRYSSGMYVRLAFAIAAHLEPEILIIDEVLAVGDAEFQKRCLGKMDEVSGSGRTVIFVSHIMPMIASLCNRCILLDAGRLVAEGPTADIIHRYQTGSTYNAASSDYTASARQPGDTHVSLLAAWVEKGQGKPEFSYSLFDPIRLCMRFRVNERLKETPQPNFHVFDSGGNYVFVTSPHDWADGPACAPGEYVAVCEIPPHFLNDGMFSVGVALNHFEAGRLETAFFEQGALNFNVVDPIDENQHRTTSRYAGRMPGVVRPLLEWRLEEKR